MSARSTTTPSAWQMYCCLSRDLSVRCSMLKEMPLLRAPENKRTGMEMSPKVKCPDQTEAAINPSRSTGMLSRPGNCTKPANPPRIASLAYKPTLDAQILGRGESKCEAGRDGVGSEEALGVV